MNPSPFCLNDIVAGYDMVAGLYSKTVLRGVNLELEPGSITGLVGRNGSGKTTMMRVALGLMKAERGQATLFGSPAWDSPPQVRKRIGFVPQSFPSLFSSFGMMNLDDCINFIAHHYEIWDQDLIGGLRRDWSLGNRRIAELSPGDQQKVAILLAVGHRPDLLVLDEPAASLDPAARREFLRTLIALNAECGQTVLLSSHIISDIERISSHIAVLHGGVVVCHAALDDIKDRVRAVTLAATTHPPAEKILARAGNRYWLWDWQECGLPADSHLDEVVLEDLFLGITSAT